MDKNGIVDVAQNGNPNELLQQEHYYPFGMGIKGEWKFVQPQIGGVNAYQYNGKELNEDYGLNWNDYGARWYDASIARWNAVDPLAEGYSNWSGYNYVLGNPLKYIDPDGRVVLPVIPLIVGAIARVAVQNAPKIYRAYKAYQSAKSMVSVVQTLSAANSIIYGTYSYSGLTVTPKGVETTSGGFAIHEGAVGTPEGMQAAAESGTIPSMEGAAELTPSITGVPSVAEEMTGDAIMTAKKFELEEDDDGTIYGEFGLGGQNPDIEFMGKVERDGDAIDISDFAIYPKGESGSNAQKNKYGVRGMLAGLGALKKWAKNQGAKVLRVKGKRHEKSSSANPGMDINKEFKLDD